MIERLEFQITNKCNIGCYYCANDPAANTSHETLKLEYVVKCIEEASPKTVLFTGGEPTLEWDRLIECIKYAKSKNINVILGSNLTTLSKNEIDLLIDEYKIDCFHTAFDDLNPKMSYEIRKIDKCQRDKLIANIEYIAKNRKFPIKVETLLLKETLTQFAEINKFLYGIGVKHHRVSFLIPVGHAKWKYLPDNNEIKNTLLKTYKEKAEDSILELTCCYFSPCSNEFKELFSIKDKTFIMPKCLDGRKIFYIMANGLFSPCYAFYQDNLPNIKDHSLMDIIEKNELINKIEHETSTKCKKCEHHRAEENIFCNNGCWALMLSETGSLKELCNDYIKEKLVS